MEETGTQQSANLQKLQQIERKIHEVKKALLELSITAEEDGLPETACFAVVQAAIGLNRAADEMQHAQVLVLMAAPTLGRCAPSGE